MGSRYRLVTLVLAVALVAACGGQAVPSSGPTTVPFATPLVTANQCAAAVTHLGSYTQRLADDLAALRPLVVAAAFDAAATVDAIRLVAATLTAYLGLGQTVRDCEATADLAQRVERLAQSAEATIEPALSARILDSQVERDGAVGLLGLLPEVLALSEAAKSVADTLGVEVAVAQVPEDAAQPVGSLPPLTTPKPTPTPKSPVAASVKASYFGSNVRITTYRVTGQTRSSLVRSITRNGPHSDWAGETVEGQTRVTTEYRFVFSTDWSGACRVAVRASPAIEVTYTIVLPKWSPPSGTSATTVKWWNDELAALVKHEKVHVSIYRAAGKRANAVLATSTCRNATRRIESVWSTARRESCEFDMKEYGEAAGLSLTSCLAH